MPKITNISELRNDLLDAYESLKNDPRRVIQVAELANTSGKIISSVKLELEYAMLRQERPDIPFMDGEKKIALALPEKKKELPEK
jgi:tRNA A37 N6-isopentenylltransferase MiaA